MSKLAQKQNKHYNACKKKQKTKKQHALRFTLQHMEGCLFVTYVVVLIFVFFWTQLYLYLTPAVTKCYQPRLFFYRAHQRNWHNTKQSFFYMGWPLQPNARWIDISAVRNYTNFLLYFRVLWTFGLVKKKKSNDLLSRVWRVKLSPASPSYSNLLPHCT